MDSLGVADHLVANTVQIAQLRIAAPRLLFLDLHVPSLLGFERIEHAREPFDGSSAEYTLASGTDDGTTSTYDLSPKKTGTRVKGVTVAVTDATAKLAKVQWNYADGSTLSVVPTYTTVSGVRVATSFQISASFPGYGVDGTLTLKDVNVNAAVDPSVFASPKP